MLEALLSGDAMVVCWTITRAMRVRTLANNIFGEFCTELILYLFEQIQCTVPTTLNSMHNYMLYQTAAFIPLNVSESL